METTTKQYQTVYPIATSQINEIMKNCGYDQQEKIKWVKWVTGDENSTSLKSITYDQANKIIDAQKAQKEERFKRYVAWVAFDYKNTQHRAILSLLHQAGWVVNHETHGPVADLHRLDAFLKSNKCPVNKPLQYMDVKETSKVITALKAIVEFEKNKIKTQL
jgi:hypothetical protein